ncbi:hypothetical protein B0H14DRAFT_2593508 [Mycena olivaceomarginata]|nr:hypothetical protein B0H14DRAFT_2593508 [Mycena olivaceomarginata]
MPTSSLACSILLVLLCTSSGRLPPIFKLLQAGTRSSSRLKTFKWCHVLQAPQDFSQAFLSPKAALILKPQAALILNLETHKSNNSEVDDLIYAGTMDLATSVAPAARSGGDE